MNHPRTFRMLTNKEIEELDLPLTALVDQITESDVESQERFRQLVIGTLANTLTAVARARFESRYRLSTDEARDKAGDVITRLVSPGSRFISAWENAKGAIVHAREKRERPRLVIVRYLKHTVYRICSDEMRYYRRVAHSGDDAEEVSVRPDEPDGYSKEEVERLNVAVANANLSQSEDMILRLRLLDNWSFERLSDLFETTFDWELSNADAVKAVYRRIENRIKAQYPKRDSI